MGIDTKEVRSQNHPYIGIRILHKSANEMGMDDDKNIISCRKLKTNDAYK